MARIRRSGGCALPSAANTALAGKKAARETASRWYELFSRHGVRAVGVDTLAAHAGVAKMTLYKYYPSKAKLALAF